MGLQQDTSARFGTTSWSLIRQARGGGVGLEELARRYWSPIYAFARRRGESREDAADLAQRFVVEVVMGRGLIDRADPASGRFRSYLMTALANFMTDERRRRRAPGHLKRPLSLDAVTLERAEPDAVDPERAFLLEWAGTTVREALARVEAACRHGELDEHWNAFEARVLSPIVYGTAPASIAGLVTDAPAGEADRISKRILTVKRRFRRALRDIVAETVDDGAVDEEMALLMEALS